MSALMPLRDPASPHLGPDGTLLTVTPVATEAGHISEGNPWDGHAGQQE